MPRAIVQLPDTFRFLKKYGFSEKDVGGCGIIMVDAVIIYKSQAFYGDVLKIEITADDFGKIACDLIYRITQANNGKEIARAKTRIAFYDYQQNKTVPIPEVFVKIFQSN